MPLSKIFAECLLIPSFILFLFLFVECWRINTSVILHIFVFPHSLESDTTCGVFLVLCLQRLYLVHLWLSRMSLCFGVCLYSLPYGVRLLKYYMFIVTQNHCKNSWRSNCMLRCAWCFPLVFFFFTFFSSGWFNLCFTSNRKDASYLCIN